MNFSVSFYFCRHSNEFLVDCMTGLLSPSSTTNFKIGSIAYIKRKKTAAIHISPYIPLDLENEDSAYSNLLLHHPWPNGVEPNFPSSDTTAVTTFRNLQEAKQLLPHVDGILCSIREDDKVIAEIAASAAAYGHFHEQNDHPEYEQEIAKEYDIYEGT